MTISRGQMKRQLYEGGGIMSLSKEGIGGGSIKGVDMGSRIGFFNPFKSAKKVVKKATKAVKKIASSDLGKAALLYAGTAGLGALGAGSAARATTGFGGIFNPGNVFKNLAASGANIAGFFKPTEFATADMDILKGPSRATSLLKKTFDTVKGTGNIGKLATLGAVSTFLTQSLGMTPEQAEEELARDPSTYLEQYYRNLNPPTADTTSEQYEQQVRDFVTANTSEYAVGGRVGFAEGTYKDFEEFMMRRSESMSERQKEELRKQFEMYMRSKDPTVEAAEGGRIGFDEGSPGMNRRLDMDVLRDFLDKGGMDPDMIVPEPEQSPDATPIPEGMMINPLQTMEFRDSNRNGIEDRREGIYLERDFIPKKDPEEFELDKFRKYFEDTKEFREVPRKNEAKGTGDPQEGINSLKPLADEQARGGSTLTLMDGTEVFIPTGAYRNGTLADIIYSSTKGDLLREDILGKMLFSKGGRVDYAEGTDDEFPLGDPTAPVNPFGPKPIGPVLPDKMMASNIENDKILEALFEKYIDMGLSPKDAAEKAMEEFDKMSMMETEGRGLAAMGGRMNYGMGSEDKVDLQEMLNAEPPFDAKEYTGRGADYKKSPLAIPDDFLKKLIKYLRKNQADGGIMNRAGYALGGGDTASDNAMQAASVEGLPVRQNPKGIKELDLRDNGGFIPPVGIKEKEDDIPAMLSNNEFVFTADAVRGMGDGNVNVGAQRMYDMMKKLEAGGRV